MIDIEKMSNHEWIDYRDTQFEAFHRAGNELFPSKECAMCDVTNDYTCLECELAQLEYTTETI